MRRSKVLAKIRAGKVARICATAYYLPFVPPVAAHHGFDGVWVDNEHRPFDPREVQAFLAFHHLGDIDCIWRPPTLEKTALYRLLEDGAAGLMIPHVSTPEKARYLVDAVKFPPLGDRGLDGSGVDANFMINLPRSYPADANRETFLTVQIETPQALENIDAIAAVPGVDVLFIGPGDLSLRLECAASPMDPKMMAAQEQVAAAAKRHGKAWGRPVATPADAKVIIDQGAQFVVMGSPYLAIVNLLRDTAKEFDRLLGE